MTGTTAGARAGLDVLLTDAVVGNGSRRFIQPRALAAVASGVARRPRSVAGRAGDGAFTTASPPARRQVNRQPRGWVSAVIILSVRH